MNLEYIYSSGSALYKAFDAEFPPRHIPGGAMAAMGYIGGNADRVWTLEDWLRFQKLRQFPIWGCNFNLNPSVEAARAIDAAKRLGWSPGRAIIGDCETNVDSEWWRGFETSIRIDDFRAVCYGSVDFVTENHAQEYIGALWDNIPSLDNLPELPPGERWVGKQYINDVPMQTENTAVDYSVILHGLYRMGGIGARH